MAEDKSRVVVSTDGGSRLTMILVAVIIVIAVFSAVWFSNQAGNGDEVEPGFNLETGQIDPGTETTISP